MTTKVTSVTKRDPQTFLVDVAAPDEKSASMWAQAHGALSSQEIKGGIRALVQPAVSIPLWRYVSGLEQKGDQWTLTLDPSSRISPATWTALFGMFGLNVVVGKGTLTLETKEHPVLLILNERARLYEQERPHVLTAEERKQVLDAFAATAREMVKMSPPTIAEQYVAQTSDYVARWLTNPQFKLSRAALPLFIQDLTNSFARAQVAPGTHVGMIASDAMAAPIMQAVLNTFHTAGSAGGATRGLALIKQFLNLSKVRTDPSMAVHFTEPADYYTTYLRMARYQQVMLADLIVDYDWIDLEAYQQLPWTEGARLILGLDVPSDDAQGLLYTLDANKLIQYGLSVQDVVEALHQNLPKAQRPLIWIPSPATHAQLAVFVNRQDWVSEHRDERVGDYPAEGIDASALSTLLIGKESKMAIVGLKGISGFRVRPWPILDKEVVRTVVRTPGKTTSEDQWLITLNQVVLGTRGVPVSEIQRLLTELGYSVTVKSRAELLVIGPDHPVETVATNMGLAMREEEAALDRRVVGPVESRRPRVADYEFDFWPLMEGEDEAQFQEHVSPYRYYFGETRGSNLRDLALQAGINTQLSYTNVYQEMLDTFGIEAVQAYLLREGAAVLRSIGETLTPANLVLLVAYMTRNGVLTPTNYHSISKSKAGPLVKGSASKAFDHWFAGGFGVQEQIKAPSASMFMATLMTHGTGATEMRPAPKKMTEISVKVLPATTAPAKAALPDPGATVAALPRPKREPRLKGLL